MRRLLVLFIDFLRNVFSKYKPKKQFPLLRKIHDFLLDIIKPHYVYKNGHLIYLDKLDCLGLARGQEYDVGETEVLRQEVKKGDSVVDCGANIGYHALELARLVGEKGKVFAFEPHPETFLVLKKNIIANNYLNTTIFQKATADRKGEAHLMLSDEAGSPLGASSFRLGEEAKYKIKVLVIALDEIVSRLDFAKLDVEGYEFKTLRGMKNILANNPQIKMLVEFYPALLITAGDNPREFIDFLTTRGFSLYDVRRNTETNLDTLLVQYTIENGEMTNILCKRDS
jgi:FkbM family methyltransferase